MRKLWLVVLLAAACGDDSKRCGDGTHDDHGTCIADPVDGTSCGDGTTLDSTGKLCIPTNAVCPAGLALISGTCQDPAAAHIDLEEGAEPNGFESGAQSAGLITLKDVGDPNGFVIHGCVVPTSTTGDFDLYQLTLTEPTLVEITADGVGGLAAGFAALSPGTELDGWSRFGLNVKTEASKRQIYFPSAGTYSFVVSDTRSLMPIVLHTPNVPAGDPNGETCYYVTLKQLTPVVQSLSLAAPNTGTLDGEVEFYSAAPGILPEGYVELYATFASNQVEPAMLAIQDTHLALNVEADYGQSGYAYFGGLRDEAQTLVVLDHVVDLAVTPVTYSFQVLSAIPAQQLSGTGETISATTRGQTSSPPNLDFFYFDVTSDNEVDGVNIEFSIPVQGAVISSANNGPVYGQFGGFLGSPMQPTTFTSYNGLMRFPVAGRYYFAVYAPRNPAGTAFAVTSTIQPQIAGTLVYGTPLLAQPLGEFTSNVFTYAIGAEPWHAFTLSGTDTGTLGLRFYDPTTAYGRLDALLEAAGVAQNPIFDPPSPIPVSYQFQASGACPLNLLLCAHSYPATGDTLGVVLKNQPATLLVEVAAPTATVASAPTFNLAPSQRVYTNLGAVTVGSSTMLTGETVAANDHHRYYVTTAPGKHVTITVHPSTVTEDTVVSQIDRLENQLAPTTTLPGVDDVLAVTQDATGFTAFQVYGALGAAETYDLTVSVAN